MTQISEMGIKKGAKKTSGKPPSGLTPPRLLGSDNNLASSNPILVDLDPTPSLSRKRGVKIQQEELATLAQEGIKVTQSALAGSLLDDDDETGTETEASLGLNPSSSVLPPTSSAQPSGSFGLSLSNLSSLHNLPGHTPRLDNLPSPIPEAPNCASLLLSLIIIAGRNLLGVQCCERGCHTTVCVVLTM